MLANAMYLSALGNDDLQLLRHVVWTFHAVSSILTHQIKRISNGPRPSVRVIDIS